MDEAAVRAAAEAHGRATVEGDLRRAGSYLTREVMPAAQTVMGALPKPLTGSEVVSVDEQDDAYVAHIRYSGPDGETTVASHWGEREGAPKIVKLEVV